MITVDNNSNTALLGFRQQIGEPLAAARCRTSNAAISNLVNRRTGTSARNIPSTTNNYTQNNKTKHVVCSYSVVMPKRCMSLRRAAIPANDMEEVESS
jgi:hypothetical protein